MTAAPLMPPPPADPTAQPPGTPNVPRVGPSILVVDDDADCRRLLGMLLRRSGYAVTEADDGVAALDLVRAGAPDLILMDVSMPEIDGLAVCRRLQSELPVAPPIIFLSANTSTQDRVEGLDAGAVDYLPKPFVPDEMYARIRAALRSKAQRDVLAAQAWTDPLTGLANRRRLDQHLEALVQLSLRYGSSLSCVLVDIDHFKRVNDVHGHAAGDAVLREVAHRIGAACRTTDLAARYGGEEFALLLPETPLADAVLVAERVREAIRSRPIDIDVPVRLHLAVTASLGVASLGEAVTGGAALCAAADAALYRAKAAGRDRVLSA